MRIRAIAPGRVNLIGEHTDYTGGLVLPMAIDRFTTVEGDREGRAVRLTSREEPGEAIVALDVADPAGVSPAWARYAAATVCVLRPTTGFRGHVFTTVPVGAGLSSSAAFEVAMLLALGFEGTPVELARAGQAAEHAASGVPCGIMDQLASAAGVEGHALLIDCATDEVTPVPLPAGEVEVVVVHSGQRRELAGTAYAERRAQCEAAAAVVGPLRQATVASIDALADETVRRRARHVVTENERVQVFADALTAGDLVTAGEAMDASHASLRDDFEVSTAVIDDLVARLRSTRDVLGARLTGGGFGGCAVALARPGSPVDGWRMRPSAGARVDVFA